jgi:glycosyltransferase involved in cell wall biosynthesis
MKPKVSVIIPSLAGVTTDYLRLCVKSLRKTVDWDIIVVTNGTKAPEKLNIPGITVRLHTPQQGQNNAVNIGAQVAQGDWLFVTNDDMYYAPGWDKSLRFNESLCFSPNLVEPVNNLGSAPPFMKVDGGFTLEEFDKEEVDRMIDNVIHAHKTEALINLETGFNLPFFIRKDLFDTIGGYDVGYDPWGSNGDTDFQTKVELAGVTPKRLRDVLVYHFSNKSGTFTPDKQAFWQHNWDYYTQKWGFNRDMTNGDPWYCKNMIDYKALKYKPSWAGKYANKT